MTDKYGSREELPTPTNLTAIFGAHIIGLDATPTGSAAGFDVVADFTGATSLINGDGSQPTPVAITNSQTDGTSIKINTRGRYLVTAVIPIVGAVTVNAGLCIDAPAGELATDPALSQTTFALARAVGLAALTMPLTLVGEAKVSRVMAETPTLGLIRLLLGNGAGTGPAAAALSLANVYLKVERIGDFEGP